MAAKSPKQHDVAAVPEEQIRRELDVDETDGTADEAAVRREGGINVAAVDANRRQKEAVGLKRAGTPRVSFGDDNACMLYDQTILVWAPPTMQILVERLGASKTSYYITSEPRNGQELYDAINQQIHRRSEECEYKVTLKDKASKSYRGIGRITLPNTLGDAHAPAPVQQPTYAPQGYGYGAPPTAAPVGAAPAAGDVVGQLLQALLAERQAQRPQAVPVAVAAPVAPVAPAPSYPGAPPPGAPPPPPGSMIFLQGVGWVKVEGNQPPAPPPPPPAPVSPQAHLQGALDTVRAVTAMTNELRPPAPAAPAAAPEPGPVTTYQVGDYAIIQNTDDGQMRPVETFIANAPKVMTWVNDQREKFAATQTKNLKLEQENLAAKAALAQREAELQAAHQHIIAQQAAIARGDLASIPAPPPPPAPVAEPAPAAAAPQPQHVNGVSKSGNGASKVRPPRMAPPSLPGAS